jgi:Uma2 family endonuclease
MTLMDVPVAPPLPAAASPPRPPPGVGTERRLTLTGIRWQTYVQLSDEVRSGVRITYDRGRMEIVMPGEVHEDVKTILTRIIVAYAEAIDVDAEGLGNWTMRREDLARGLEPDDCYSVATAALRIATRREGRRLDLTIDPPPDLVVEIDISPAEVAEPPIYAALGVPEIWRYDGRAVTYLARTADGQYATADRSLSFPDLPVAWVNEALAVGLTQGHRAAAAEVRRRVVGASPAAGS